MKGSVRRNRRYATPAVRRAPKRPQHGADERGPEVIGQIVSGFPAMVKARPSDFEALVDQTNPPSNQPRDSPAVSIRHSSRPRQFLSSRYGSNRRDPMGQCAGKHKRHASAIGVPIVIPAELARVPTDEGSEAEQTRAVVPLFDKLLQPRQKPGRPIALGEVVITIQPPDCTHMGSGRNHCRGAHIGEERHKCSVGLMAWQ